MVVNEKERFWYVVGYKIPRNAACGIYACGIRACGIRACGIRVGGVVWVVWCGWCGVGGVVWVCGMLNDKNVRKILYDDIVLLNIVIYVYIYGKHIGRKNATYDLPL